MWPWRDRRRSGAACLFLWFLLGMLRVSVWQSHLDARLGMRLTDEPQAVRVHGLIVDDPVGVFDPREPERQVCVMRLLHAATGTSWRPITGRVRAVFASPRSPLAYGDEVLLEGRWSLVPSPGNPGQYDWRAALARERIHGVLRVKPFDGVALLRRGHGQPWLAAIFRLRQRWECLIRDTFEPRDAGLLLSLLLGERVALEDALKDAFVETGTIHLLVISGSNVALVACLFELLFRLLGWPWRFRLCGMATSLGGYCLLTGLQPPVARATLMAWAALGAFALDRVVSWPNILAASALVILWINPMQLFDPGCQLSFGAVLSLIVFTPRWMPRIESCLRRLRPTWLRRYVGLSLCATAAVWVGLWPVLAWYFHLVSPVSVLANLCLAPLMSALVSVGTGLLILGTWCGAVVSWGSGLLRLLLWATIRCVSWCHAIPGGSLYVPQPPLAVLIVYYGLIGLSLFRQRLGWSQGRLLIGWGAALSVWLWSLVALRALDARWLRVDILDVGHGDCIVIRSPRGHAIIVDTGTQDAGRAQVIPFLRHAGIASVDALVLTHTDTDHLGGAIPLLSAIRVRRLLTNGVRDDTPTARRVRRLVERQAIPQTALSAGMTLRVGPEAAIEVLHPPHDLVPGTDPPSNDNSVVLRLGRGAFSVLLSGDIEEAGLAWLLRVPSGVEGRQGRPQRVTALKVPHHGSRLGAVGAEWFRAVRPAVAIISIGREPHLPAPETIRDLRRVGAAIYSTRDDGAIALRTDGVRCELRAFRSHKTQALVLR